ncbi:MAG: alpha/beta hydrolase [Rhodospirillales bacterium]|nr:alpha/beta hydrolase [Rhodospirillales bacterium]
MAEARHEFIDIDGCKLSVNRAGTGEKLLFLHGAGGAARWAPFMADLADRYEVIVPEHPGFGRSDTPPWLENVGDLAYFYLDFIEREKLGKVHLVGTSLGGWIAAELAVRDQAPLATLTLVAPAGIHLEGVPKGDIFLWTPEQMTRNLVASPALAEQMLAMPVSDAEQRVALQNSFTMAKLSWQPRLYNPHLAKWLHRVTVPTQILWGDQDKVIPTPYGEAFKSLIPGSRLQIFSDCGHVPQIEKKDDFVAAIADFAR